MKVSSVWTLEKAPERAEEGVKVVLGSIEVTDGDLLFSSPLPLLLSLATRERRPDQMSKAAGYDPWLCRASSSSLPQSPGPCIRVMDGLS